MRNIVIGYDGSASARRALERTAQLVDDGASVTVVGAVHLLAGKGGMPLDPVEREEHERQLEEAKARLAQLGLNVNAVEGYGDPAKVIVAQAKEVDADLIVVGTEHKNLIERLLVGSVSAGVAHRAPCDVLVVA
jgi:nucleotide-binding universal stress UspA family protein